MEASWLCRPRTSRTSTWLPTSTGWTPQTCEGRYRTLLVTLNDALVNIERSAPAHQHAHSLQAASALPNPMCPYSLSSHSTLWAEGDAHFTLSPHLPRCDSSPCPLFSTRRHVLEGLLKLGFHYRAISAFIEKDRHLSLEKGSVYRRALTSGLAGGDSSMV